MNILIVIPTHSNYIDICIDFLKLFSKYWEDCPYKMVISICGAKTTIPGYDVICNGSNATLPQCIYNAAQQYNADYYMCFLGDAFITKMVDTNLIKKIIEDIYINNINYCSLLPMYRKSKEKRIGKDLRYINSDDRYSHTFIAFICTSKFVLEEFNDCITDLDFENKYLNLTNLKKKEYFKDRVIVKSNYLNLYPGIKKGCWDRRVLHKLKKENPELDFSYRKKLSFKTTIINFLSFKLSAHLPNKIRIFIKKNCEKILRIKFVTKN